MTCNRSGEDPRQTGPCCGANDGSSSIDRRRFLQVTGSAALVSLPGRLGRMAGPFQDTNEYLRVIPKDKRLAAGWVRSLHERGTKDEYSDAEALRHIGMPVGGLFAGTVYLGGDGRLWLWDVFNRDQEGIAPRTVRQGDRDLRPRDGANYVSPAVPDAPVEQGFTLRVRGEEQARPLSQEGFPQVRFRGEYPRGVVRYADPALPVEVVLEAFSPFVPLDLDASSLPVTILRYTVHNTGEVPVELELEGHLRNPVCHQTRDEVRGRLRNQVVQTDGVTVLLCSAEQHSAGAPEPRTDVAFEDFERGDYGAWTVEGTAFGDGPVRVADVPGYQGDVAGQGERVVNSHASAPGDGVGAKDAHVGTLTSPPFTIPRRFVRLRLGGGAHQGRTCVQVLVDGAVVAEATGRNDNRMQATSLDVAGHQGARAQIRIVDRESGPWGNVGVDEIVFTDRSVSPELEAQHDFGTMALALFGAADRANASEAAEDDAVGAFDTPPVGALTRVLQLGAGEEATVTFALAWHFPNLYGRGVGGRRVGNHYASRFGSALDVVQHVARNLERLVDDTRTWVETWYDSTLPYWLLDRTMANTSTLATTTCYRFEDGRFWAWEGIGCCAGTCTHVWHYAQAPGRLFGEIERITRERVDFGAAFDEAGVIGHRENLGSRAGPAHDGQCGRILGVYREHQTSADDAFLRRLYPKVRRALEYLIARDGDDDGMIEGPQPNTLDASWYGRIPFLASLYIAALRAGAAMATEIGDDGFAERCRTIAARGAETILQCFNGEFFAQIDDPEHRDAIGAGAGCYVDQLFGQTWAHQVGLGRLLDRDDQLAALRALWRYNFVPDVGVFREAFPRGRWYAMAGDAGLVMCTWPKGGKSEQLVDHWQAMYFNECMSGFEWQAAAHMVWEGRDQPDLLEHGLAIARAIHDRYHGSLRNPYNEIECSDHYARAMASYGVFQAACGFEYHGPRGFLAFSPRLGPDDFKAAFTAAEGWGSLRQTRDGDRQVNAVTVRQGSLRLSELGFDLEPGRRVDRVRAEVDGVEAGATLDRSPGAAASDPLLADRVHVRLDDEVVLGPGQTLTITLG